LFPNSIPRVNYGAGVPLQSDVVASAARYAKLETYCSERLLDGAGFRCSSEATCRASSARLTGPPVFSAG